nr:monocarboxylate transporter 12-like [Vanessa tameamea]
MGVKEKNGKKYELVAPDGGWGYMIGVGVIINLVTISTFLASFGMIFKDLFIELNMDSTTITFLNGVSALCAALAGMIVNPLLKFLSLRQLGLVAATIFNLGIFGNVFVNSKLTFFLCLGVLQSLGNGLIYNISCTVLNNYFVKRRLLAVSFTQTVIGVIALFSPQFVKWTLETFGFRGTLLIISAVSLQNIVGMALMQPVEWHMKKVKVSEDNENETKSLLASEEKGFKGKEDLKPVNNSEPEHGIKKSNEKLSVENTKNDEYQGRKNFISNFIDVSLFKTFLLSNAAVGVALSLFSEYLFIFMLPQALYALGWNEGNIAWALTLNAVTDLGTRAFFILMSSWLLNIGSHEIYVVGLVLALITKLGMLWSDDMLVMTVFITMMGIPRCTIMLLLPVVVADSVDQDKFSSAMGIVLLLFGFFNLSVGPSIGAIRDLTNSYSTAFYILSSCFGIVIMFWTIELIYKKNKHKRIPKEEPIEA